MCDRRSPHLHPQCFQLQTLFYRYGYVPTTVSLFKLNHQQINNAHLERNNTNDPGVQNNPRRYFYSVVLPTLPSDAFCANKPSSRFR